MFSVGGGRQGSAAPPGSRAVPPCPEGCEQQTASRRVRGTPLGVGAGEGWHRSEEGQRGQAGSC